MKFLIAIILLVATTCAQQPADHFTLTGAIPGAIDGTKVTLVSSNDQKDTVEGYVVDGKFELRGRSDMPTLYSLKIDDREIADKNGTGKYHPRQIDFFVENGTLTFVTPHIDSLPYPPNYRVYDLRKEKNYKVTGSAAQDIFYPYQQQTIGLRYAIGKLHGKFMGDRDMDVYRELHEARTELERLTWELAGKRQNAGVSLYLAGLLKKGPFMYDQPYLDRLDDLLASFHDVGSRIADFRQSLKKDEKFNRGKKLEDAGIITPDGKTYSLTAQLNKGGYTLIDFWASWCGPCRASFPHLREIYRQFGDKVKFISLSTDTDEEKWHKAGKEENLPWSEFRCSDQLRADIGKLYGIIYIPVYLVVDPAGEIIFHSDNSGALALQLEALEG